MIAGSKVILFPARPVDRLTKIENRVANIAQRTGATAEELRRLDSERKPDGVAIMRALYNACLSKPPTPEIGGMLEEIAPTRETAQAAPVEIPANVVPLFGAKRREEIEWRARLQFIADRAASARAWLDESERIRAESAART